MLFWWWKRIILFFSLLRGDIDTEYSYDIELESLASTFNGRVYPASNHWISQRVRTFDDVSLLLRQKQWIPSLRDISFLLGDIFTFSIDQDSLFLRLGECESMFAENWEKKPIFEILDLIEPVNRIFRGYSFAHFDYIKVLSSNPALVQWLIEQEDHENFNNLINVSKSSTDDPMVSSRIRWELHFFFVFLFPFKDRFDRFSFSLVLAFSTNSFFGTNAIMQCTDASSIRFCCRNPNASLPYHIREKLPFLDRILRRIFKARFRVWWCISAYVYHVILVWDSNESFRASNSFPWCESLLRLEGIIVDLLYLDVFFWCHFTNLSFQQLFLFAFVIYSVDLSDRTGKCWLLWTLFLLNTLFFLAFFFPFVGHIGHSFKRNLRSFKRKCQQGCFFHASLSATGRGWFLYEWFFSRCIDGSSKQTCTSLFSQSGTFSDTFVSFCI